MSGVESQQQELGAGTKNDHQEGFDFKWKLEEASGEHICEVLFWNIPPLE